jgi:hypothetical protein
LFKNGKHTKLGIVPAEHFVVPNAGIAGIGPLIAASGLLRTKASTTSSDVEYSDGACLAVHVAGIASGNSNFVRSEELRAQGTFAELALNVPKIMSTETLRQREDEMGRDPRVEQFILECMNKLVAKVNYKPTVINLGGKKGEDVTRIFIDNSIFENRKCKKEGVTPTYDKRMGYFPAFAYDESFMPIYGRLLEGNTSSLDGVNEFIDKASAIQLERCPDTKQLFILDAAYDALPLISKIHKDGNYIVCKLNKRRDDDFDGIAIRLASSTEREDIKKCEKVEHDDGSTSYYVSHNRTRTKPGLFTYDATPEEKFKWRFCSEVRVTPILENGADTGKIKIKVFTVLTNIFQRSMSARKIIELYRDRGAMEQNFAELKAHMGHEKFPSGKLGTNRIVFSLMLLAMTMLRIMGTYLVECILNGNKNYGIKRRLAKTIIRHFMRLPGVFTKHGRKYCLKVKGYFEGIGEAFCRYFTDICQIA